MIKSRPVPGKNNVFSYNSDKHHVVDTIHAVMQKTRHKLSKDEIWIMINEYEDLLRTFIIDSGLNYRWYIPKVGFITPKRIKKERRPLITRTFNEEFLKIIT